MLDRNEAEKLAQTLWDTVFSGLRVEERKIDLKRDWWDLNTTDGQEEFIKDISAIANTPGGDGYIIIGIDESQRTLHNAPLPIDEASIQSKAGARIIPRVIFTCYEVPLGGGKATVIWLPKSNSRPHVLKVHRNRPNCVYLRYGTQTNHASRFDLDEMYGSRPVDADPQLILRDQDINLAQHYAGNSAHVAGFRLDTTIITGARPMVIDSGEVTLAVEGENGTFGSYPIALLPSPLRANEAYHPFNFFIDVAGDRQGPLQELKGCKFICTLSLNIIGISAPLVETATVRLK